MAPVSRSASAFAAALQLAPVVKTESKPSSRCQDRLPPSVGQRHLYTGINDFSHHLQGIAISPSSRLYSRLYDQVGKMNGDVCRFDA